MLRFAAIAFLVLGPTLLAQTQTGAIQATGSASVNVTPDQATFTIGVVTQASTVQEASSQNAAQAGSMIASLNGVVGKSGTVQTIGYSVTPRYSNSNPPNITGYTATNTVQVVTNDLARLGLIIDTGNQQGGNNISGISFSVEKPDPYVQQALGLAAKQALAHAAAIASGLGAKTGNVLSAQEGSSVIPYRTELAAASANITPIQPGTVAVSATVNVSVQLVQ